MEAGVLKAVLVSIGEELKILKAQMAGIEEEVKKRFTSLKGLWKNKTAFSFEDIKKMEIKLRKEF